MKLRGPEEDSQLMLENELWIKISQQNYHQACHNLTPNPESMHVIIEGHMHDWVSSKHSMAVLSCVAQTTKLVAQMFEEESSIQSFCRNDQLLLFNNNAHLFGVYNLAKYLTRQNGLEQIESLFGVLNLSTNRSKRDKDMFVVEDSFQKIDFLEFNDNDVLIHDNHFSHLSSFCKLLDEFVGLKDIPSSLYGLLVNTLICSTDHWPFDQIKKLEELERIQTLGKHFQDLLIQEEMTDFEYIYKILVSMSTLTVKQPEWFDQYLMKVNSEIVTNDDKSLIVQWTQTLEDVFSSEHRDELFVSGLERLKYGNYTLESYNLAKQLGMTILKDRSYKVLEKIAGKSLKNISHHINFEDALLLCHAKCTGMNTFGEQIEFYTGVKDYQSPLGKSKTTNMPKILSKLGMLSKTKSVGEYPEKIELLKKFLRDPQVFALFLVSLMTKKSDQLAALHSLANELMFKNSLESHVFEHGFLTNHEVLDDFQKSFYDLKQIMNVWSENSLELVDGPDNGPKST